jgi:sulfide:quinone oxidoreductase
MPSSDTPSVTIVGGGTAALEALLAARAALGPAAGLRLIAPERAFRYRPIDPEAPLRPVRERSLRIADITAEADADWVVDRVALIDERGGTVLTRDGDTLPFEYLLIAAGARSSPALYQGELWVRGGDPGFLDEIIDQLADQRARSVAVVIPRGARWPLPAYELALVLAWSSAGTGAQVMLATAELAPLAALGADASRVVRRELDDAGVDLIAGVEVVDAPRDGPGARRRDPAADVILVGEEPAPATDPLMGAPTDSARIRIGEGRRMRFDRLISLPTTRGPLLDGVAMDAAGFIEVDATLRVRGSRRIWAAGACLAATFEHSALAACQADAAVAVIAAEIAGRDGAGVQPDADQVVGILLSGQRDAWLAENPAGTREPSTRCLWWPPGRAVGRLLAEQIVRRDPLVDTAIPAPPDGLIIRAPVTFDDAAIATRAGVPGDEADRSRDIQIRQRLAIDRRTREAEAELRELEAGLETLAARQQRTVRELQRHGYLHGR